MPNHLTSETSPYLRQNAHNPVDWYPWVSISVNENRLKYLKLPNSPKINRVSVARPQLMSV